MNLKKFREIFIYKVLLLGCGTVFSLYTATTMSELIRLAADGNFCIILPSALYFILFSILYFMGKGLFSYYVSKREVLVKQEVKFSLYRQFFSLSPVNLYRHRDTGDVLESFRDDFDTVTGLWCDVIPSMALSFVSYIVYLVYAGSKSWQIALLMLLLSQLQMIVPLLIEPKFYDNYGDDREWEAKTTNAEIEAHTAFRDIRIFGLHKWYLAYLAKFQNGMAAVGKQYEYLCGTGTALETLVHSVLNYGTYAVIGVFVFFDRISLEDAVLLLYLSGVIYSSLMEAYNKIVDFSENRMEMERLSEITKESVDAKKSLQFGQSVEIKHCMVSVEDKTILDVGEVTIHPNRLNVLVGVNGSGKSTLLKVLAGFLIPQEAEITVSGQPYGVFYLPQDDLRLQETAFELVPEAKRAEYIALGKTLGLTEELFQRPIATLSGGECKKIYLALAFLEQEAFLLLDEPTNHLDCAAKEALAVLAAKRKHRMVLVTHDEYFLAQLEQRQELSVTRIFGKEAGQYAV